MAQNDWVIQVQDQVQKAEGARMVETEKNRWQRRSIYKLPACVINLNKNNAYTPQVVSFGPYHCKNENLKPMEEHKDRALVHFLRRSRVPLKQYYESLLGVLNDLMDAYNSLDADFQRNSNVFLKLMIRDGSFMLEILRASKGDFAGYAENDPIFSDHGRLYVMPHMKRDMLMLENQLPMKVLHKLHQVQNGLATEDEESVNELVFKFFFEKSNTKAPSDSLHIIDMFRKSMLQSPNGTDQDNKKNIVPKGGDDIIRSAVELHEAGIKIKRSKTRSLRDITFKNGELRLPMIIVDDTTEPLFLNLIAFERFHVGAGNEVTAYVFFMDNIIDDAPDISLLHSKDIIQNGIGSDKAAAKLFNSLSKDVTLDQNSHLGEVYTNVNAYCKRRWPKYRANLTHTYFTNPWALLSFLAAIFLFALTITQTVYSILPYYNQ